MTTLSLAMIVKNAEPTLARALDSVAQLCDELVVVDTGSRDCSVDIAALKGAEVHKFAWIDDFSAARNFSFQRCTGDWIIWLDADDVISKSSIEKLLEVKRTSLSETIDAVYVPYQTSFDVVDKCEFTVYRERILRRQAGLEWWHSVHECIKVLPERALYLHDIFVEHRPSAESRAAKKPERNLRILEKALSSGDKNESGLKALSRMLFYYGNELFDHSRFEASIDAYKRALETALQPFERYWATRAISNCYSALEQPDKALEWGLQAIEVDPERAEALNDIGMIYYKQKRFAEAITFFSKATVLQKPQTSFVEDCHYEWLPYEYLSSCYTAAGDYERALENGLKALAYHPQRERLQANINFLNRVTAK